MAAKAAATIEPHTTTKPIDDTAMADATKIDNGLAGPRVLVAIAAIIDAMGEGIAKGRETTGTGPRYKFRGIEDVYKKLNPLLAQHGLIIAPRYRDHKIVERTLKGGGTMLAATVTGDFDFWSAEDGSMITVTTVGEAMDVSDKSSNKAMSISHKYACLQTFCIPTEDIIDDPEAETHTIGSSQQETIKQPAKEQPKKWNEADARAEMTKAENLLRSCTTKKSLDEVWNTKITWSIIPKGWVEVLRKINAEVIAEIDAPKPPTTTEYDGAPTDEIPF